MPVIDILSGDDSSSNHDRQHDAQNKNRLKETVFSSEVHSFEYDKPEPEAHASRSYETDIDGNSVVYPNSCALDVNVTYDLIDGEFPPPSGLTVRSDDSMILAKNGSERIGDPTPSYQTDPSMSLDLLSQSPPPPPSRQSETHRSRSGESPSQAQVSRGTGGSKEHMGGIAIDEYEGSPRRYRPRFDGDIMDQPTSVSQLESRPHTSSVASMSHQDSRESINRPESSSNSTLSTPSSSVSGKVQKMRKRAQNNHSGRKTHTPVVPLSASNTGGHSMASSRLPGFPQRVLPTTTDNHSTPSSSSSKEESPLSDHKSSIGGAQSSPSSSSTSSSKSGSSKRRFNQSNEQPIPHQHSHQQLDPMLSSTQNAAALIASLPTTMSATSEQQLHYQQQQFLQHQKELQQQQQQHHHQQLQQHLLNTSSNSSSVVLEAGNRLNIQASKQGNESDVTKPGGSLASGPGSSSFEPPKIAPSHVAESSHDLISQETLLKFDEDVSKERRETPAKASSDLYDYQYEFSETRKVLDEFFPETRIPSSTSNISYHTTTLEKTTPPPSEFRDLNYTLRRRTSPEAISNDNETLKGEMQDLSENDKGGKQPSGTAFLNSIQQPQVGLSPLDQPLLHIGNGPIQGSDNQSTSPGLMKIQRNATAIQQQVTQHHPQLGSGGGGGGSNNSHNCDTGYATLNSPEAASRVSHPPKGGAQHGFHRGGPDAAFGGNGGNGGSGQTNNCDCSRNFTLSPETTDCDSADLESEVSMNEGSFHSSGPRLHTAMPILEDGLSSGHASDLEEDVIYSR